VVAVPGGQLGAGGEIGGEVVVELCGLPHQRPQRALPVLDLGGRSEHAGGGVGGALGDPARVEGDPVAATAQLVGGQQAHDPGADHGDVLHVHIPPDGGMIRIQCWWSAPGAPSQPGSRAPTEHLESSVPSWWHDC